MPDNPPASRPIVLPNLDSIHDLSDAEVLLITCHLANTGIEQDKSEHEFQEAVGAAESVNGSILFGDVTDDSAK